MRIAVAGWGDEGFDGYVLQVFGKTGTFEGAVDIIQFIEQSTTEG